MEVYDLKFSHLIWDRLQKRFMSACISRSVELKRLLSHVKKKDTQTMDQYLLEIKILADKLAAINSPVSARDLIEYAIIGLGRGYESLINNIDCMSGIPSLEDIRPILQAQEQRNLFFQAQESSSVPQAFVAAPASAARGAGPQRGGGQQRGPGGGRGPRGAGRARGGRGRGGRGSYPQQYGVAQPQHGGFPGQPAQGQPRPHAFSGNPGFPSADPTYQYPPPPVVCQLCFSPGHSALHCSRFTASHTPALAALPTGENNDSVWYPDSGASAHMTPHEGHSNGGASSSGI
ncbi:unnamed protein product [Cuscuta epithymum]|uniref:Retrotransposon gag domain-containing protein n=1 Tax=Cuscuta epithymum TaxID=186058 RepID=A0AAV0F5L0_9ASTE|nr:unnamed protein product [Cuscuta epithymum]